MAQQRLKPVPLHQWEVRVRGDPLFLVLIDTLFDHENRIRVLEGKPEITKQQALQAFRNRLQGRT